MEAYKAKKLRKYNIDTYINRLIKKIENPEIDPKDILQIDLWQR